MKFTPIQRKKIVMDNFKTHDESAFLNLKETRDYAIDLSLYSHINMVAG